MTVTRKATGSYVPPNDTWVDGSESTFPFTASVQPITPLLVDMLPEGSRDSARFSVYAEIDQPELISTDITTQVRGDRVAYDGRNYWVQSTGDWTSDDDGIPHYEYVLLAVGKDEPGG
jgi:hypothetical protein